jgi:hypothetical protein
MIGKLRGVVDGLDDEDLILDVNGVGYLVAASANMLRGFTADRRAGRPADRDGCARGRHPELQGPQRQNPPF